MKLTDPRLRASLIPARSQLLAVGVAGVLSTVLLIAQAWALTGLIVAVVSGRDLTWAVGSVLTVIVLRGLVGWWNDAMGARAAAIVGTSLRHRVLAAQMSGGSSTAATGAAAVLDTRGISAAEPYLTRYLPAVVLAVLLPPLTVAAIATQDLLSAVIVLGTLPLIPLFGALVGLATRDRAREQWKEMASLSGHFLDVVRGLPTLIAFGRAKAQSSRISVVAERYRRASLKTLRLAFASSAVLELVATMSVALVAVSVGIRLAGGNLDLRTALLVLLLAPEAYWPLRKVGAEFHAAAEGATTFQAVHDATAGAPYLQQGNLGTAGRPLLVDGLSLIRAGRSTPTLDHLSFSIPQVGITAVTGPSGCGKSTLLEVLAALLPPSGGTVTCGGQPAAGSAWQAQVAWLPQRPHFTAGTVADNLRLAVPSATDDQLWNALRRVALEQRVRDLPTGLATEISEDGLNLSAGERARLALARVVLAGRPWVLLDEPTAHLDPLTERIILDTVSELGRTSSVVVVAHRPAVTALADHVIELAAKPLASADHQAPLPAAPPSAPGPQQVVDPAETATAANVTSVRRRGFGLSTSLSALASASGVALTATAGWLIVQASTRPAILTLLVAIVSVRAFGLARPVLRYAERLRSHDTALRLLARRRVQVYDALVPLTPARLGRRRGDILASVVDDVDGVVDHELRVIMPVKTFAAVSALAVGAATLIFPPAALVLALSAVTTAAVSYWLARLGAHRAEALSVSLRADLSTRVVEAIQTAPELRMWQAQDRVIAEVIATSDRLGQASSAAVRWLGSARAVVLVIGALALAAVATLSASAVSTGELSGPMAALLVLIPLALIEIGLPVADAGSMSVRTEAAAARLRDLERTPPALQVGESDGEPAAHDLDVSNVQVRWQSSAPITYPVTFHLDEGSRIGIVGSSGSGKSTLAALLLRFLDPELGSIRHGGIRTTSMSPELVRRVTGLVDDDPHIFATTLVENVRLADPTATDAEVADSLRRAHLGPWLQELPDGLDTWLGDGHAQVSGGERARIALARSLLARQPVLVLDEPAAHLDHATAVMLAQEILAGPRDRSVVWITHESVGLDLVDSVLDLDADLDIDLDAHLDTEVTAPRPQPPLAVSPA